MARQHVHNRRAGRGGGGSYWISYSDIMAALVLVFVLFLVYNLYHYTITIETKQNQLNEQQILLDTQAAQLQEQEGILIIKQGELESAQAEVEATRIQLGRLQDDLASKSEELETQRIILIGKQQELDDANEALAAKEAELIALQAQLEQQQEDFERETESVGMLVGVRAEIIQELTVALAESGINASVDPSTGDIVLESTVFFESNKSEIREDGKALLDSFLPVYLGVLLQPKYEDYLGEIIVEGHTDSTGDYIRNLKLSQDRALNVAVYCLGIVNREQRALMQNILTAKGRSSSDLIYNEDGTENRDASRRVEFKFSLRDAEMIDEMNRILTSTGERPN